METPVLFLIFNRPDKTRQVFERIREAKPAKLFIAADGPRSDRKGESDLCAETRRIVLQRIDWPCEVKTLFRDYNLGCKLAVSSAIDWFFDNVEEGIILEDDCLPDMSFFRFCSELLERYRDDTRIMMISGSSYQPIWRGCGSYFFTRFTNIWGWASWRRAWHHYDLEMKEWPRFKESKTLHTHFDERVVQKLEIMFDHAYSRKITTWDIQWLFASFLRSGLNVEPNTNLVTNIDGAGTHMKIYDPRFNLATKAVDFPLLHPGNIEEDLSALLYSVKASLTRTPAQVLGLMMCCILRTMRHEPHNLFHVAATIFNNITQELQHRAKLM